MTRELHLSEVHRCGLTDDDGVQLAVRMDGEYGTESVGAHWHWHVDEVWLEVDGEEREPSAAVERAARAYWKDLPGMPEAISRWERK
jgi:hypothetical protein